MHLSVNRNSLKLISIIFFLLAGVIVLHGQSVNFQWVKQMGGNDTSNARGLSIVTDDAGNVYTTGFFKGNIDFDPGPGAYYMNALGVEDIYVSKLDSFGKLLWVRQMDVIGNNAASAKSRSIAVNNTGKVFITGNFLDGLGNRKCFASKLDPSGNVLWTKILGEFTGTSIKVDDLDNIFIAGIGSTMSILKLDTDGNVIWTKTVAGVFSQGATNGAVSNNALLALDGSKNIYISGSFYGTVDFDPSPASYNLSMVEGSENTADVFVLKLNEDGNFVWAKKMGGSHEDVSVSTAVDNAGNVYTFGNFMDTVDFDPGPGTYDLISTNGNSNSFICRLDANGNFVWAKQFAGGTQWCYAGTLDQFGNIYTTGYFRSTLDFDPGPGVQNLSAINYDIFISKLDLNGEFAWVKQMGGTAKVISNSIAVDATQEKIYTTGYFFGGQIDFDPGPANYYLTSNVAENIFIHKMVPCKPVSAPAINASACRTYTLNGQTYNASGVYKQILTSATNCDSIFTLNLTITAPVYSSITTSICEGHSVNGHIADGVYTDTLIAANGCDSIVTLQLTVLLKPSLYLGADRLLCTGDSLQLYAGEFTTYVWQDGSSLDYITVKKPGIYSVIVSNNCGSATDEIIIQETDCKTYFPNAFTPNDDGLNDVFKILNPNNITEYHLSVYNQWGQKVFETYDSLKSWDGRWQGQLQKTQVFIWQCEYRQHNDVKKVIKKGTVTLLR